MINNSPPFLLPKAETTSYIKFNPLNDHPGLFTIFAELSLGDDEESLKAIINFTNEFGLLTTGTLMDTSQINNGIRTYSKMFYGVPFSFYLDQIRLMKNAFRIWNWLQEKNSPMLAKVITRTNDNIRYFFGEIEDIEIYKNGGTRIDHKGNCLNNYKGFFQPRYFDLFNKPNYYILNRLEKDDYLLPAQLIVQKIINQQLDKYTAKPLLLMDKNNTLKQFINPTSLLSCMWFQFFQVVTGERKVKQCAYCGRWEDVTDKYASWKYHKRCGVKKRVEKHRSPKKEGE